MLDDFEDGDGQLFKAFDREGRWFSAGDPTPGAKIWPDRKFQPERLSASEAFQPARIVNLAFSAKVADLPADFWVDDIAFVANVHTSLVLGIGMLDVVRGDLAAIASRAPSSERTKIEQHQAALRDIEKRLAGVERTCAAPAPPDRARFPRVGANDGGAPYLDAITAPSIASVNRPMSVFWPDASTPSAPDVPRCAGQTEGVMRYEIRVIETASAAVSRRRPRVQGAAW